MGKGDLRSKRGKIYRGTKGKSHQKKRWADLKKKNASKEKSS